MFQQQKPKPLLFITATRLGDAVLSTGVLMWFLQRYPEHPVHIACGSVSAPLFEAVPHLKKIHVMRKAPIWGHWRTLLSECWNTQWAAVIDLRRSITPWLLRAERRWRWTPPAGELPKATALARGLGIPALPPPHVWLTSLQRGAAAALLPRDKPVLALAPTAGWRGKEWPVDRFITVAEILTAETGILPGAAIAVAGSLHERDRAAPLLAHFRDRAIDLMGSTDLLTLAACFERSQLFIGNDSGLMHLAAAAGVPTLGLFGPSNERIYRPTGPHTAFVRTPESLAELTNFRGYDSGTVGSLMGSLSPAAVIDAASALWRRVHEQEAA
ncbi:MAG: glycosyltransferase family 9 protein [Holosporales bacterium]